MIVTKLSSLKQYKFIISGIQAQLIWVLCFLCSHNQGSDPDYGLIEGLTREGSNSKLTRVIVRIQFLEGYCTRPHFLTVGWPGQPSVLCHVGSLAYFIREAPKKHQGKSENEMKVIVII